MYFTQITELETIKTADYHAYGCMAAQVKVR